MPPFTRSKIEWFDPTQLPFRISGLYWFSQEKVYRRLPQKLSKRIPPAVNELANYPAGAQIAFRTDSLQIAIKVKLTAPANMPHMPATGQCGFDLYVGKPFQQRFYNVTKYDQRKKKYEMIIFQHNKKRLRNFVLNFPLYQQVREVKVGLTSGSNLVAPYPFPLSLGSGGAILWAGGLLRICSGTHLWGIDPCLWGDRGYTPRARIKV